jgi:anaerobic magnesium-protoporphyrin IX monomethyl ester cyclase
MSNICVVNMSFTVPDEDNKVGYVPIGPLYICSVLEKAGHNVKFVDYIVENIRKETPGLITAPGMSGSSLEKGRMEIDYMLKVLHKEPDFIDDNTEILAMGCTSATLPLVLIICEKIRASYPNLTIILGGVGPTGVAKELLSSFKMIDVVVIGEGEETIVDVIENIHSDLSLVKGIGFHKNNEIVITSPRSRIKNLDAIPYPSYEKISIHNYMVNSIAASRGCVFPCTFCDTSQFWTNNVVLRSVDNVLGELKFLMDTYGLQSFEFVDNTFVWDRKWLTEFCDKVKKENLNIKWGCTGKIELMDESIMEKMAESGCEFVLYGIETGSNSMLRKIKKGFKKEQGQDILRKSLPYFTVMPSYIWGWPFESFSEFTETIEQYEESVKIGCWSILLILCPLPMSTIYKEYKHTLKFDGSLVTDKLKSPETKKMLDMIKAHPDIFPGFYYYDHEGFQEKYQYVIEKGHMKLNTPSAFLNGLEIFN